MGFRAVLFDLGGVVLGSPLHAIARFEREHGVATGAVNRVVVESGPTGAWSRLERGELELDEFIAAFEADCHRAGFAISARALMERVGESIAPRSEMLEAIRRIRSRGLGAAAVTNNWKTDAGSSAMRPHFDAFVESCVVGVRKPDPRIYRLACEALGVEPGEAVFLDDIGLNLKSARALGMTTLKVEEPGDALRELEGLLGFALLAPPDGSIG